MAPERKALTAAQVATVRTPGKYHDGGGMGLMLRVQLNGARQWVQRIRFAGRRIEIGLGSPPAVSLAQARERAIDNKRLARGGSDPRRSKQAARAAVTFGEASERYLASKLAEFRNARHREQWRATLRAYALPALGRMAVRDIGVAEVLGALEPIWWEKTVTATRVRQRIEAVLSWARVAGLREGDNPARWQGNLSELLPKPGRIVRTMHHPAVALGDAARWWQDSSRRDGMAVQALRFAVLCAARSGEVRHATWAEFDLDSAIWTVPAERMKAGVEHRVPLTEAAVALLGNLPRLEASPFVFFAARGGALSDMALSQVMRRLQEAAVADGRAGYLDPRTGRPAVQHGWRSTFKDWATENGEDYYAVELSLAHKVGSAVDRAYRRTDLLEKRRELLARWHRFLEGA
jgi:integrase